MSTVGVRASHERLAGIQYARAFAALAVMLSHAVGDVASHGGSDLTAFFNIGAAGVDLFFIISGFVMVHSSAHLFGQPGSRRVFLGRRLLRVVPLYWLATTGYLLLLMARGNWHGLDASGLAASLVFWPVRNQMGSMLPTYGIGWTLNYEMFFYVCFAVALGFRLQRGLWLIVASLCAFVLCGRLIDLPGALRFWAHPVLLDFIFGLLLGMFYRHKGRLPRAAAILAIMAGLVALIVVARANIGFSPDDPEHAAWRWLFWGLPCAAVFAGLTLKRGPAASPHRLLGFLGDASYALYLVHPIVIILLRSTLPSLVAAFSGDVRAASLVQLMLITASTVIGAALIHLAVEKPILRLGRRSPPQVGSAA
ncbi:acyltransferase family protein [Lichenifustis flavocetrariae]|uniref:Acyltransferase n=1 Tax=Lichenifustis flavocetrariae TaxID=2949735 RepID=A0AA42CQG8_9HYPH|nr:acyltransferase [Lichenifustis flavocetrariae]MCW6511435.1 acyltransferase [Lichenifustis flavocetrariae]